MILHSSIMECGTQAWLNMVLEGAMWECAAGLEEWSRGMAREGSR